MNYKMSNTRRRVQPLSKLFFFFHFDAKIGNICYENITKIKDFWEEFGVCYQRNIYVLKNSTLESPFHAKSEHFIKQRDI